MCKRNRALKPGVRLDAACRLCATVLSGVVMKSAFKS